MKPESKQEKQHQSKEEIDGGYYCTCHLCDSDYDSEYDSEYGSYSEYSSYSEWEDEEDGEEYDSDSAIEEEVWYDSDYFNEHVYNMRPQPGWDATSIPRNRYHLPESVLQNNENLNFYVNNINNRNGGDNNQTLLDQRPPRPLLNAPNHSRQPTTSSSSTLVEENSTDDNRNNIPHRRATYPIPENGTNQTNNFNSTGHNHNHRNSSHHMNSRNRRHGLRYRRPSHSNGHNNNSHNNNNNDHNNDNDSDNDRHSHMGRSNSNNSQSTRRSKRKIFFSHFMFVIALISTLALVLFVQLFGYILTAADQARGVTLRLSNHNRQQPVCDNNERTNTNEDENGESTARTNENPSSSIPNADPEVLFTEEIPDRTSRRNNDQHEEEESETEEEVGTENESEEEEEKDKEKKKEEKENEEDKEKNDFLAHLASLRAAQAMAGSAQQNYNPNHVNDPTRLNDPTRANNPSQRLSSYLSNYVYYNSDIYSS